MNDTLRKIPFLILTIIAVQCSYGAYTTKDYVDRADSNSVLTAFGYITQSNSTSWTSADGSVLRRLGVMETNYADKASLHTAFTNANDLSYGMIVAATNALPDWTKSSSKPSYSPWEIGALGIYDMADSAWYAYEAGTAYHANGVDWSNVSGRPQNIVTFDQNADDPLNTAEKILERASAGSGGNNDYFIEDHGTGFSYRIVATNGVLFAEKVENAQ